MRAHIDHTFQAKLGTDRRGRNAVLTGTGFCDDAGLAHATRQNDLTQHVVDLMCARVVQLVALKVNLGPAKFLGHAWREIEWAWTANVMRPEVIHLGPE